MADAERDQSVAAGWVLDDSRVFVSTGYGMGAALIDVSKDGEHFAVRPAVAHQPHEEPVHEFGLPRRLPLRSR